MNKKNRQLTDQQTADAFSTSWNSLPKGSVYTMDQFEDWFHPVQKSSVEDKTVLELGCGNGSLLLHLLKWKPKYNKLDYIIKTSINWEHKLKNEDFS